MNSGYPRSSGYDLPCFKSDGAKVLMDPRNGYMLVAATYYFYPPESRSDLISVHLKWAAAVAGTITVENSNFPEYDALGGSDESDRADTSDTSSTAGDWIQENPSTAIVATAGASNTSTAATVTAGGAAAGGCMFHLGNIGSRRARIKFVVSGAGGLVRCAGWGKGA